MSVVPFLSVILRGNTARQLALNASRRFGTCDPVAVAEALGLRVYAATREECGGSPALLVGDVVLVSDTEAPCRSIARAVALVLIDQWRVETDSPSMLARDFARELGALAAATSGAESDALRTAWEAEPPTCRTCRIG